MQTSAEPAGKQSGQKMLRRGCLTGMAQMHVRESTLLLFPCGGRLEVDSSEHVVQPDALHAAKSRPLLHAPSSLRGVHQHKPGLGHDHETRQRALQTTAVEPRGRGRCTASPRFPHGIHGVCPLRQGPVSNKLHTGMSTRVVSSTNAIEASTFTSSVTSSHYSHMHTSEHRTMCTLAEPILQGHRTGASRSIHTEGNAVAQTLLPKQCLQESHVAPERT